VHAATGVLADRFDQLRLDGHVDVLERRYIHRVDAFLFYGGERLEDGGGIRFSDDPLLRQHDGMGPVDQQVRRENPPVRLHRRGEVVHFFRLGRQPASPQYVLFLAHARTLFLCRE
jgi:hypothetical protein